MQSVGDMVCEALNSYVWQMEHGNLYPQGIREGIRLRKKLATLRLISDGIKCGDVKILGDCRQIKKIWKEEEVVFEE